MLKWPKDIDCKECMADSFLADVAQYHLSQNYVKKVADSFLACVGRRSLVPEFMSDQVN